MRERTACGLACMAVVLAASLGSTTSQAAALGEWSASHYRLSAGAQKCVVDALDHNEAATSGLPDPALLRQRGLEVVPLDRRQLIGDIMLTCALSTGDDS